MVQKSCISWSGKYPIIYRGFDIPGGDRRISEPSIVAPTHNFSGALAVSFRLRRR